MKYVSAEELFLTQRNTIKFILLIIGILLAYTYSRSIFLLASHHLNTDLMLTYLSGKMLNAHAPGYHFSNEYLSAHHQIKTNIIPNLSPPFSVMLAALISRYLNYQSFFILFMASSVSINIFALIRLYQHVYSNRGKYYILTLCAFIFAYLVYMPTFMNIGFGQVALILNALIIFSYLGLENKKYIRSGLLLAFAINIKIFFGIFLIYFLAKKQYGAFFSLIIFSILIALTPLIFYGASIYNGYWHTLNNVQWYGVNWNASWYGFFSRILGETSHRFHSVLFFPKLGRFMYQLTFLTYVVFIYYFSKKNINSSLTFAFTLSTMLLISPLGWTYYFPLLITAFIINFISVGSNRYYVLLTCLLLLSLFLSALPFPLYRDTKITPALLVTQGNIFFISLLLFNTVNFLQLLLPAGENKTQILTKKIKLFIFSICLLPSLIGMSGIIFSLNKNNAPQSQPQDTDAIATINDLLPSNTD